MSFEPDFVGREGINLNEARGSRDVVKNRIDRNSFLIPVPRELLHLNQKMVFVRLSISDDNRIVIIFDSLSVSTEKLRSKAEKNDKSSVVSILRCCNTLALMIRREMEV